MIPGKKDEISDADFRVISQVLIEKVKDLPKTPEGGETSAKIAGAFAAVISAEKARAEMLDLQSEDTRRRRRLEHLSNKLGFTAGAAGILGTLVFLVQNLSKQRELDGKQAEINMALSQSKLSQDRVGFAEEKMAFAERRAIEAKDKEKEALARKQEATQHLEDVRRQESASLEARDKAVGERDRAIQEKAEAENLREAAKKKKDEFIGVYDSIQNELVKLPEPKKVQLRQILGPDSVLAQNLIVENQGVEIPAEVDSAEARRLRNEAMKLFDSAPGVRGDTYTRLTTGSDRRNPLLLEVLLKVGDEQLNLLQAMPAARRDSTTDPEASRLRRGLENVVVTIRDMSRSVTKIPPANREKCLAFAAKLIAVGFGTGDEAKSLQSWLNNGNDG